MQITAPQVHAWYDEEQHVVGVTVELILSSSLYLPGRSSLWPRKRREPLSRKYREEGRLNKTTALAYRRKGSHGKAESSARSLHERAWTRTLCGAGGWVTAVYMSENSAVNTP